MKKKSKGLGYTIPLAAIAAGWGAALAIYYFALRPNGNAFPKSTLLEFGVIPAFVFIVVLVVTLLIRPIYSHLGFGSLGRLDEATCSIPSTPLGKIIFKTYETLGVICIAMAAYCQLIFSIVFFLTKTGAQ